MAKWNLGDVFAGIAQGVGSGMTMNAKNEIDTQNQMNMETRRAELDAKRTEAMARLNRELTEPDRKQTQANADRDYGLRSKVADAQIDDHSARNEMTGKMNEARAGYLTAKAEADALRADAAKTKAAGGGMGGTGAGKREFAMNDVEKEQLKSFQDRLREADKEASINPAAAARALSIKQEMMDTFGGKEVRIGKDGRTEFRDRLGNFQSFKSAEEARKAGWGSEELDQREKMVNEYKAKQSPPKAAKPQSDAGKIAGLPSPSNFNLIDMAPKSEEDQRAEALAVAYRFKGMSTDKLQAIIKSAKSADEKMAAEWAFVDAMSRGTDFANGGM